MVLDPGNPYVRDIHETLAVCMVYSIMEMWLLFLFDRQTLCHIWKSMCGHRSQIGVVMRVKLEGHCWFGSAILRQVTLVHSPSPPYAHG